jgi:hypothetical protein
VIFSVQLRCEQLAQVIGGLFIGYVLDIPTLRRSQRSKLGWIIAFVLTFSIYGGGFAFQKWADTRPKGKLDFSTASECLCTAHLIYLIYALLTLSLR